MVIPTAEPEYLFSGAALRQLRKERGLSVTAFAVLIGRSGCTVTLYEAGNQQPSVTVLSRMAAALGCRPGDLCAPVDPDEEEAAVQ
jgi:transcriptional regulator with XRE-family HTH domain